MAFAQRAAKFLGRAESQIDIFTLTESSLAGTVRSGGRAQVLVESFRLRDLVSQEIAAILGRLLNLALQILGRAACGGFA